MLVEIEARAEGLLAEGSLEQPFVSSHIPMAVLGGINRIGEVVMLTKIHSSSIGFLTGIQGVLSISNQYNMEIKVIRDSPVSIGVEGDMQHPQGWAEGARGKHHMALVAGGGGGEHSCFYCTL